MSQMMYDPSFCSMEWPDGNWLWMQSASYCSIPSASSSALECNWNLSQDLKNFKTPVPIPASFSPIETYTCDNQLHDLKWTQAGKVRNRYICACGKALSNTTNCAGRCDVPWIATFEKQCNVITRAGAIAKGNFSSTTSMQGTCLRGAGQRSVHLNGNNPIDAPEINLKANDVIIMDGFGLTQVCSNDNQDRGNGRICNCQGALPETAWGHKVAIRDACGIDSRADKAWIAAPVIGGIALIAFIAIVAFLFIRRRNKKQSTLQDIPLQEFEHGRIEQEVSPVTSIPESMPSVSSEMTVESFDSGVALVRPPPSK